MSEHYFLQTVEESVLSRLKSLNIHKRDFIRNIDTSAFPKKKLKKNYTYSAS